MKRDEVAKAVSCSFGLLENVPVGALFLRLNGGPKKVVRYLRTPWSAKLHMLLSVNFSRKG